MYKVLVELYNLLITGRKGDRSGRVMSTGSMTIEDIITLAAKRRSDISPEVMLAVYRILRAIALEEVCNSKRVEFGLTHNGLFVDGVFIGDHPVWDKTKHRLYLSATAAADVREAIAQAEVEIVGMASSGLYVNTLTDVTSGEVNKCITPGGGVNLSGVKIKIVGDSTGIGIHLTEINTSAVTTIPMTSILVNEPSKISFIVPKELPAGDYKLSITTQFNPNILLKDPRTYIFDYVLTCN